MDTHTMRMNHPKGGTRINNSKSQAKAPETRHTALKKWQQFWLEVGSVVTTNAKMQTHTFIIKRNIVAPCVWNIETL